MEKILKIKNIELMIDKINEDLKLDNKVVYNIEELLEIGNLDISLIDLKEDVVDLIMNSKLLSWHGLFCKRITDNILGFYKSKPEKTNG